MKYEIIAAAILAHGLVSFALGISEVNPERYPDADAVLVDEKSRVKYNPDGTYELTSESWTKILTEKGRRSESVLKLDYSKRYGEAKIVYVGAIGTNGIERTIDVSATTKESTDNSSMSANIYDPLDRTIVCTIPGLKTGETVHVKTLRKATKARCEHKWADISVMEWTMPIVRSSFEVVAPAELPLRRIAIRNPLGNITSEKKLLDDGTTLHTFTATNSPQAFPDPDMPTLYTQIQNVRVSTAENWEEISKWYWNLCEAHLAKTNAAMAAKVAELGADVRKIFTFVSQEIRYMGLTMEDTSPGYAPHDVDITFDNRYGVCRDKAGLLVAMLTMAGHKAYPVLIHVGAKLDPEVPQPFFNHAIVAAEVDGEFVLMDPTNENAKDYLPSYESDKSYLICRPEGDSLRTSPVPDAKLNAVSAKTKGALSRDGSLFIESDVSFDGINDTMYRAALARMTPEDRVKFFSRVVKSLAAGTELITCSVEPRNIRQTDSPLRVSFKARLPEALLKGATRSELNVPFVTKSLGFANFLLSGSTSLDKRRFPLTTDSTASVSESVEIDLGGAVGKVEDMPPDETTSPGYSFSRQFSVTNDTLSAVRTMSISKVEFSPDEYLSLRESIKATEKAERRKIAFTCDPLADADTRILFSSTETDIFSDKKWTTVQTTVSEALTYQGKRDMAEMKFTFNPAVSTIELVYAVVSNKDGTVKSVTPREKNIMDASWAASAPRYPASKILVVNLPGVEVGSVISYKTIRTTTNAPASFYGSYLFDSQEPLNRRIVRINDYRREVVNPKRIPSEPGQPAEHLWRDLVTISSNRFEKINLKIRPIVSNILPPPFSIRQARDWMAKHVRITGPSLYELPLDLQLTDPETVLKERYATRLDYVRTLCSLLLGAGYEADVVLSALNSGALAQERERSMRTAPNLRAFSHALCRVKEKTGGFLGFGAEEKTFFIGAENEYSPLGATAYENSDFFDPSDASFGIVTAPQADLAEKEREETEIVLRENGDADITVKTILWGIDVGPFRKRYAEILPEELNRHHQAVLGAISQAATATAELDADFKSYPATRTVKCYVPGYASIAGDTMTLKLPQFISSIPSYTGRARQTPFTVAEASDTSEKVTIQFPEGYTSTEHLPESFSFENPTKPDTPWLNCTVKSCITNNCLKVTIERNIPTRTRSYFKPDMMELVRDRSRIASSQKSRTISARRR